MWPTCMLMATALRTKCQIPIVPNVPIDYWQGTYCIIYCWILKQKQCHNRQVCTWCARDKSISMYAFKDDLRFGTWLNDSFSSSIVGHLSRLIQRQLFSSFFQVWQHSLEHWIQVPKDKDLQVLVPCFPSVHERKHRQFSSARDFLVVDSLQLLKGSSHHNSWQEYGVLGGVVGLLFTSVLYWHSSIAHPQKKSNAQ
jgi:hypothetical protein